jgi:hypothetical protein
MVSRHSIDEPDPIEKLPSCGDGGLISTWASLEDWYCDVGVDDIPMDYTTSTTFIFDISDATDETAGTNSASTESDGWTGTNCACALSQVNMSVLGMEIEAEPEESENLQDFISDFAAQWLALWAATRVASSISAISLAVNFTTSLGRQPCARFAIGSSGAISSWSHTGYEDFRNYQGSTRTSTAWLPVCAR